MGVVPHSFLQRWARKLRVLPANRICFGDVQAHAKTAPYTFHRPSAALLESLEPGDLVKVWFEYEPRWWNVYSGERMWVIIKARDGDGLTGELDNIPFDATGLKPGDKVQFRIENVLSAERQDPEGDATEPYWAFCTTSQAVLDGAPVDFLARSEPLERQAGDKGPDSGWSILAAGETGEQVYEAGLARSVPLGRVLNNDDRWLHLIDEPPGQAFEWSDEASEFVRLAPFEPGKEAEASGDD